MPRLLDLFCGAGGAAMGYSRAGFEVVGVDIKPQPHYPFEFHQADALRVLQLWRGADRRLLLGEFDAIHASPPCQAFTAYRRRPGHVGTYPNLIPQTREALQRIGLPWIIENVVGAPLTASVTLCGSMFDPPLDVRRHRLFETSWPIGEPTWGCRHGLWSARFPSATNRRPMSRLTVQVGSWNTPLAVQRRAMGIDWTTLEELSEAIPPAYTEWIGRQLIEALR